MDDHDLKALLYECLGDLVRAEGTAETREERIRIGSLVDRVRDALCPQGIKTVKLS